MPSTPASAWTEKVRQALLRYEEPLLRRVANQLLRPRSKRPVKDLVEKMAEAMDNAAMIDRRLEELAEPDRSLLGMISMSRQPAWTLRSAVELAEAIQADVGPDPVFRLLDAGLIFPDLPADRPKIKGFADGLGRGGEHRFFAHPDVTARASVAGLTAADERRGLSPPVSDVTDVREADGLEILLRLGVLWQQVKSLPLRLTQQGEFFKRDHDRLTLDPLLVAGNELHSLPSPGHLLVSLGLAAGLLRLEEGEIVAGEWPDEWRSGIAEALTALWAVLPAIESWNAAEGWRGLTPAVSPYPSASLLALVLLSQLPEGHWMAPAAVAEWLRSHHIFWRDQSQTPSLTEWSNAFLLGLAYPLRLVQVAKDSDGNRVVRLSPLGEAVLGKKAAPPLPSFPQTLLVQPNLEIIVYRQGLTPELIGRLTQFCAWKSLGAACLLQLQPETVYRGLEAGLDYEQMQQLLQKHSGKEVPANVVQLLKTWADKRERLTVYPAGMLLEFETPEELQDALGRGLPGMRVADRLLLVAKESDIDYKHFKLTATRDYGAPPDRCVEVGSDGVTLAVDLARADLLLETEMQRFADPAPFASRNGRRVYQLTPASLGRGRERGVTVSALEDWFYERTGQTLSPAARLLLAAAHLPPFTVKRLLVIETPSETAADGVMQWPATRELIQSRLGPRALAVEEQNLPLLQARMQEIGVQCG